MAQLDSRCQFYFIQQRNIKDMHKQKHIRATYYL